MHIAIGPDTSWALNVPLSTETKAYIPVPLDDAMLDGHVFLGQETAPENTPGE